MFVLSSICFADEASNVSPANNAKQILGAVVIFDNTPPTKNDMYDPTSFLKDKSYRYEQLNQDYNINRTIRQGIMEKYSSRSLEIEMNDAVTASFNDYTNAITNSPVPTFDTVAGFADKYKYDYLIVVKTTFTKIERKTDVPLFTLPVKWIIDADVNVQLYSKKDGKFLYNQTMKQTVKQPFTGPGLFDGNYSVYENAFQMGINNLMLQTINKFEKEVPSIVSN